MSEHTVDDKLSILANDWHFALTPLRAGTKVPVYSGYMDDPRTEVVLKGWHGNVAVVLNKSNLVVVDIDMKNVNGLQNMYEFMLSQGWQLESPNDVLMLSDLVVKTPNDGYHLYFYRPEDFPIGRFIGTIGGVDILSNGLAVLPPSTIYDKRNKKQKQYMYMMFGEPTTCDDDIAALLLLMTGLREGKLQNTRLYEPFIKGEKVKEGSRFAALQSLAGYIAARTSSKEDLHHWLSYYDKHYCDPPLQDTEPAKWQSLVMWASSLVVEDDSGRLYKPPAQVHKPALLKHVEHKHWWLHNIQKAKEEAAAGNPYFQNILKAVEFFALDSDEPFLLRKAKDARLYRPQFAYYNNAKVITGIEQAHVSPILRQWGLKIEDILPYTPEFIAMATRFYPPHKSWKRFIITEDGVLLNTAHKYGIYLTDEEIKNPPQQEPHTVLSFLKHIAAYDMYKYDMLLQWIYALIFMPEQKLPALVLHSPHRATGKTMLQRFLAYIMGGAAVWVSNTVLEGRFNASFASARLCLAEEVLLTKRKAIESLKAYITNTTITVEGKFVEASTRDFFGVFCLSTNNSEHLPLAEEEDRFILLAVPKPKYIDTDLEKKLYKEARLFVHWMLHNVSPQEPQGRLFFSLSQVKKILTPETILDSLSNIQLEIVETIREAIDAQLLGTDWTYDILPSHLVVIRNGLFYVNINALISILSSKQHIKTVDRKDIYLFFKNVTKAEKTRIRVGNERTYAIALSPTYIKMFDMSPLSEQALQAIANNPHMVEVVRSTAQALAAHTTENMQTYEINDDTITELNNIIVQMAQEAGTPPSTGTGTEMLH